MKLLTNKIIVLLLVITSLSLFSCGKKGDLYLEGEEKQAKDNNEEL
jgi:predicted small lipoprotein YifL